MPARVNPAARVLLTTDAVGGVWTYALDLARGLAEEGLAVMLAVLGPPPSPSQHAQAEGLELAHVPGPLDWTARDEAELAPVARALAALAARLRVDVIHLNSPALAALAVFDAPVLGACHSCTATWWAAVRGGPLPSDLAWRRDLLARGYAACDALVAPTAAFARATAQTYGVEPAVVWNGRAPAPRRPVATREPIALTAGRLWDEAKGAATLDAAAGGLGHRVVALGDLRGPDGDAVRFAHLETPGRRPPAEVAEWMGRGRVFASAAAYEPFGLAVLEAAQAGCALVLSDLGTFRELWEGAAMFAPVGDAGAFAAALDALLRDDALAQTAADRAQNRARRYGADAMTAGVLDLYRRLASGALPMTTSLREAAA